MVGEYAPQWKFRWFNAHKCKLIVIGTIWGGGSWSISGEEIEEGEAFKYLDVFSWTKNERMAYVGALCLPKPT